MNTTATVESDSEPTFADTSAGLALLAAKNDLDCLAHLVTQLVRYRTIGANPRTEIRAYEEVHRAIDTVRATYLDFDLAAPFLFMISTAIFPNAATIGVIEFLEICVATLEAAAFCEPMRAMLPALRKNRDLKRQLKELTN